MITSLCSIARAKAGWKLCTETGPRYMASAPALPRAFLSLEGTSGDGIARAVCLAISKCKDGLYVVFDRSTLVDTRFLDLLGTLYGHVASTRPRYNLVPILPNCDRGFLANLHNVSETEADEQLSASNRELEAGGVSKNAQVLGHNPADVEPLRFAHVALGGTFDRLHAGHRLLLAAAVAITSEEIYIGITGDKLLASKVHKELIYSFDERRRHVSEFVTSMNPALRQTFLPLLDPDEPTRAETSAEMSAIVVSEETIQGARSINKGREALGLSELEVIVVPVLQAMGRDNDKLSSTALRAKDASSLHRGDTA